MAMEASIEWTDIYPVSHDTTQNSILGFEKQVLQQHGTPERIKSETRFWKHFIDI